MLYNRENGIVTVSSTELAAYAIKKPINPTHSSSDGVFSKAEHFPVTGLNADEGLFLTVIRDCGDCKIKLTACADKLVRSTSSVTLELVKGIKKLPGRFVSSYNTEFLAEAVVTAYAYCVTYSEDYLTLRLTFVSRDSSDEVSFERDYDIGTLTLLTDALISRAEPFVTIFAERMGTRIDEIKALSFPYGDIRSGQHELMLGIMKTIRRGGKLVASAPTGTGKTMASLFPSIKAIGGGLIDKVFYLTGMGVTGKAAFDAMKLLAESAPHLRCITIRAKESSCATNSIADGCFTCPRMNDVLDEGRLIPYKQRRNAALAEILTEHKLYDSHLIDEKAEKYKLCPYELSLDVSEFCETVICDYNYVFDSRVRFKRYFTADTNEKFVFLIDEAHNLPDRVRASYSAELSPWMINRACERLGDEMLNDPNLGQAFSACSDAFDKIKELCLENPAFYTDKRGEHRVGYYRSEAVPDQLISAASVLVKACRDRCRDGDDTSEVFAGLYGAASSIISSASICETGFAFLAELSDENLTCRNICLDPSEIITDMSRSAHATVMFSATLDPIDYFADMLGCSDAPVIKAESPFDPQNMSVTIFDGISTRYNDRHDTAYEIAEVIASVLEAKEGHYFVFFPSYKYMRTVAKALLEICPDIRAVMQKSDMSFSDREKFISAFRSDKFKSIVGLCVLGGVFSEGVDLTGDKLIGTIIVGAGLPGISSELNLMSEYFESKYGMGHLYAYEYPAINKIEQAAGRVIRTATDRGVVVLIDDRLSSPEIAGRFPEFWPQISCTSDVRTLSLILERFWGDS